MSQVYKNISLASCCSITYSERLTTQGSDKVIWALKTLFIFPSSQQKNHVWFLILLHCKGLFPQTFIQTQVCLQCFGISVQRQPGEQKILKKNKACLHEKAPGKFKKTPDPSDQSTWLSLVHWVSFTTLVCVNYKGNWSLRIVLLLATSIIKRAGEEEDNSINKMTEHECFLIWWQVWTNSSPTLKCLQFQAHNRVRAPLL